MLVLYFLGVGYFLLLLDFLLFEMFWFCWDFDFFLGIWWMWCMVDVLINFLEFIIGIFGVIIVVVGSIGDVVVILGYVWVWWWMGGEIILKVKRDKVKGCKFGGKWDVKEKWKLKKVYKLREMVFMKGIE